jgi:hypothetical protein
MPILIEWEKIILKTSFDCKEPYQLQGFCLCALEGKEQDWWFFNVQKI